MQTDRNINARFTVGDRVVVNHCGGCTLDAEGYFGHVTDLDVIDGVVEYVYVKVIGHVDNKYWSHSMNRRPFPFKPCELEHAD